MNPGGFRRHSHANDRSHVLKCHQQSWRRHDVMSRDATLTSQTKGKIPDQRGNSLHSLFHQHYYNTDVTPPRELHCLPRRLRPRPRLHQRPRRFPCHCPSRRPGPWRLPGTPRSQPHSCVRATVKLRTQPGGWPASHQDPTVHVICRRWLPPGTHTQVSGKVQVYSSAASTSMKACMRKKSAPLWPASDV